MLILDEVMKEQVEKQFRIAYTYKSDAKEANASATEALNTLADVIATDKSKEGLKIAKKVVSKAYREWQSRIEGDDSSDLAIEIANIIVGENE